MLPGNEESLPVARQASKVLPRRDRDYSRLPRNCSRNMKMLMKLR
jgi:hypothetical protein